MNDEDDIDTPKPLALPEGFDEIASDNRWNLTEGILLSQFEDGDVLAPWVVFQEARVRDKPIPEWCLMHIDKCGERLLEGPPAKVESDEGNSDFVSEAFSLKRSGGGRGPWVTRGMNERLEPALRELIHEANKLSRRSDGSFKGIGGLYEKMSEKFIIGRTTLEKAFRKFYKEEFHYNKNHKK